VTTNQTKNRIPNPLYAAAGAGDLAYQKLRTLPAKVAELRGRTAGTELDVERLRGVARRNAAALVAGAQVAQEKFVAGAQVAQEKAVAFYTDLVARGEQVVKGGARATESVAAEIAADGETEAIAAKPAKRTRPAARKSA